MNIVHTFINHVCAAFHKLVDYLAYQLFVARNRGCRNNKHITGDYLNLPVLRKRYAVKRRKRFALTSGRNNNKVLRRIVLYHIDFYQNIIRNVEISELRGNGDNVYHASS